MSVTHTREWVIIKAPPGTETLTKKEQQGRWRFHISGTRKSTLHVAKCMNREGRYAAKAIMRKSLETYGVKS